MIITKKKNPDDVIKMLEGRNTVYLFGCNACAEQCRTGGEKELNEMTETLGKRGFHVAGSSLLDETCYTQRVKKEFRKKPAIKGANAIVVLACGAGVKTVADSADPSQPVLPALDTVFLASVERQGRFFEGCSLCGNCVLDKTAGICPHTDCPKGLLNGPCGGVADGMCEVNAQSECAWVRIYKRLKTQDRVDVMKGVSPPKDYSSTVKPRNLCLR